jgi:hypothetical protein
MASAAMNLLNSEFCLKRNEPLRSVKQGDSWTVEQMGYKFF